MITLNIPSRCFVSCGTKPPTSLNSLYEEYYSHESSKTPPYYKDDKTQALECEMSAHHHVSQNLETSTVRGV